jgi:sodium/bile acid cotransporter 7
MVALFVVILMVFFMWVSWKMLTYMFKGKPELVIMGFFGCHHKTVAMGLPLLKAIYEEDPKMGMYALPLLIWHPLQLIVGTALAPRLQ